MPAARKRSGRPQDADGQATALAGLGVLVLGADCLPIALAGGGAVAMLHAGWRGLAAGVVEEGVRALRTLLDARDGRERRREPIGAGAQVAAATRSARRCTSC